MVSQGRSITIPFEKNDWFLQSVQDKKESVGCAWMKIVCFQFSLDYYMFFLPLCMHTRLTSSEPLELTGLACLQVAGVS